MNLIGKYIDVEYTYKNEGNQQVENEEPEPAFQFDQMVNTITKLKRDDYEWLAEAIHLQKLDEIQNMQWPDDNYPEEVVKTIHRIKRAAQEMDFYFITELSDRIENSHS